MPGWTRAFYVLALAIPVATHVIEDRVLLGDVEAFDRFTMPGEKTLGLEVGDYSLYMESRGRYKGGSFEGGVDNPLHCKIIDPGGDKLLLLATSEALTYDVGDFAGKLFVELEIATAGAHQMICSYSQAPGSATLFALGSGRLPDGKQRMLRLAIACGVAVVLILLTLVLRRRKRG